MTFTCIARLRSCNIRNGLEQFYSHDNENPDFFQPQGEYLFRQYPAWNFAWFDGTNHLAGVGSSGQWIL
jgi:hypothetical protein